ncbi:DUF3828 domain-containing protein [Methylobacterium sp. Leaf466]|uniref:DUF3828 domain-containing protein n=1 Tax=Methylobacterium sp. Leaf466 TaxID=1736386 RepID=UPI0006F8E8A8|nr:DUF3828 domain-containing protein [Methylobacterium sp. Leaf466]KQT90495.1 hypothetical protein ASG59_01485 [Methylobacterium sp. Leaf466]
MRLTLALLVTLAAAPAIAQSATDPVETVRALYAADDVNEWRFLAKGLRTLFEKDATESKGEVGRLGFAYHVNGQDTQSGWRKTLVLKTLSANETKAEVQARFKNFSNQDLRYDLVKENGLWLVTDVRALTKERWRLEAIMSAPLP